MSDTQLTHLDQTGAARMVDVTEKQVTTRTAVAAGVVHTTGEVVALLRGGGLKKGDAIATARIAGIMGAKRTPDLIPLCHPIALHKVAVELDFAADDITITATTSTADRTGVEMEALTSVAVAGLTLIDMIKAVDPAASLDQVRVLRKEGGKTGLWRRDQGGDGRPAGEPPRDPPPANGSSPTDQGGPVEGGPTGHGGAVERGLIDQGDAAAALPDRGDTSAAEDGGPAMGSQEPPS